MTKQDYIIRQIAKTNKKNYENYVVTRIIHLINANDVKFVTQQYVSRPKGHALTDLYFPQFGLHIEIDEPHHKNQIIADLSRETDIVNATQHKIKRIKVGKSIDSLNVQIDDVVEYIMNEREDQIKTGLFKAWDFEQEFNPAYYKKLGYLGVSEDPKFRTIRDACNLLGQNYGNNVQMSFFKAKKIQDHHIWFPKFYNNDDWDNSINQDGTIITEICKQLDENRIAHFKRSKNYFPLRVVFPRYKDNLNKYFYRFKGVFRTNIDKSNPETGVIHERVSTHLSIPK